MDVVGGGSGNDVYFGGSGTATMIAGSGANLFAFVNGLGGGADTIEDFDTTTDRITLQGYAAGTLSDVLQSATVAAGDDDPAAGRDNGRVRRSHEYWHQSIRLTSLHLNWSNLSLYPKAIVFTGR